MEEAKDASDLAVNAIPMAAFNALWTWADVGFGTVINAIDYQRRLWQPWIDLQLTLVQQSRSAPEWPGSPPWMFRGVEQLA